MYASSSLDAVPTILLSQCNQTMITSEIGQALASHGDFVTCLYDRLVELLDNGCHVVAFKILDVDHSSQRDVMCEHVSHNIIDF